MQDPIEQLHALCARAWGKQKRCLATPRV